MQIFEPLRGKRLRLRQGIEAEHGRPRHVALLEADALAVLQVDGGKQNHRTISRKGAVELRSAHEVAGRGRAWGVGATFAPRILRPPPPRRLRRRPSPPLARARGGREESTAAWKKLTVSISRSSKSGPARSAGSSPGETGYRSRCPWRRLQSPARRNLRGAPQRRPLRPALGAVLGGG